MLFENLKNKLSLKVEVGNIKPSSKFIPQLSQKGIKGVEFCNTLNSILENKYQNGNIVNVHVFFKQEGSGKTQWQINVKGRDTCDIIKEVTGIQKFNQTKTIDMDTFLKIKEKYLEDYFRIKGISIEKTLLSTLSTYNIRLC